MLDKLLNLISEKPEILISLSSGVVLPIVLIWLTNHYNLKQKNKEKELEFKYNDLNDLKVQERLVYSSLSKILFDVQQLHVALSGNCIDNNCIDNALTKFEDSVARCHGDLSKNLLYMPSKVINLIYQFYSKISDLKIKLKEFNESEKYEMAHVSVYVDSQDLAETLIEIQELIVKKNNNTISDFDKTQQEMMKYCCGRKPPQDLFDQYITQLKAMKPELSEQEIEKMTRRWKS